MTETRDIVIETQERSDFGKNASRRQRHGGFIPAVLYGGGGSVLPLMVDPKRVEEILYSPTGANTLFGIKVSGKAIPGKVIIKEHQLDPVTQRIIHSDFMRIAMDKMLRVQVQVHTTGVAKGVRLQAGIVDHPLREIELECLPQDIPERIDVDITELELGRSIRVGELTLPPGVKLITDPGKPVVSVVAPTVEKVAEPGAAAAVEAPTEPEVIRKGKEVAEGAEAAKPGEAEKGGKPEKGGKDK
jgi:large subunit ribosomal protein L25